jgi:hypothetical protein
MKTNSEQTIQFFASPDGDNFANVVAVDHGIIEWLAERERERQMVDELIASWALPAGAGIFHKLGNDRSQG